jgi:ATP-binding cassette subfamily B protein
MLPAAMAWIGKWTIDSVVAALAVHQAGGEPSLSSVYRYVAIEAVLAAVLATVQRGLTTCQSLLRLRLGQRVNLMILEKAITLRLAHFEDSALYDKLTRARQQSSARPLSVVMRIFRLFQNTLAMLSGGALLWYFSPLAVLLVLATGIPLFVGETKFSVDAFWLMRSRSPEARKQLYLETVLSREDYAKEVQLLTLGPYFLRRYRALFAKLFARDQSLEMRRTMWGIVLGLVATAGLYAAYGWVALSAVLAVISVGEMTMYLALFRQGQSAVSSSLSAIGGLYEDSLYLSTLYDYLDEPIEEDYGLAVRGPRPGAGIEFCDVTFSYPGAVTPALANVDLTIRPGETVAIVGNNGSGKSTMIKLLARLYDAQSGLILVDGLDIRHWNRDVLRRRLAVLFQDFVHYQLPAGENIGLGDVRRISDLDGWVGAAQRGMADQFIRAMPKGYSTQLGKWFDDGCELSGGQWQKIALSRTFMSTEADILILDEPTAAMDPEAEATFSEEIRQLGDKRMAIIVSHRMSTVRHADRVVVLHGGRVVESGDHRSLLAANGRYARLFSVQSQAYR